MLTDAQDEMDPREYVVDLLMVATGFDPSVATTDEEYEVQHQDQRHRLEEVVGILMPAVREPIDPEAATARLVEAARAAYHNERWQAIDNLCPGGRAMRSERWREAIWEAEWPEHFDLYQELAAAIEPFGGVGPDPYEVQL